MEETLNIEYKRQWRDEWLQQPTYDEHCGGFRVTIKQLAEILEVSERQIDRYIKYLRENGFLDRTKNNRYGEWIIKK